ncbi:MAG: Type 1 glutamine amidotransferase-like domain-containing protein [Thermoleophilaceae bacterium]
MSAPSRQIVAFGGGGFSMEAGNPMLDQYVLGLTASERPRVCFLPTASGDADHYIVRFYRAFCAVGCETSHVSLFRRDGGAVNIEEHLTTRDVIYVGGGSVVSLLGAWRAHGLDVMLRRAWEAGVVLCGVSAGSLCWFDAGVTAFHGPPQEVRGLGLLPWSNCVHFDKEPEREEAYRALLRDGMCAGFAAEDGTALHFVGEQLERVVSSRPEARAYHMRIKSGALERSLLPAAYLGAGQERTASMEAA